MNFEYGEFDNFLIVQIIMGCDCLGPKKSQEEVFLKLIKSIHEESEKITIEQSQTDLYPALVERIAKKGELRKLTDNLSSRKHKIQDALAFNYKLTSQSRELGHWEIGLMVADSISEIIYLKKFSYNSDNFSKSDDTSQPTLKNQSRYSQTAKKKPENQNVHHNMHYQAADQQYFKIISYLYPLDAKLKRRILQSVNRFCDRHVGVIGCETELWGLIDRIVEDLKNGTEEQACSLTLKNLMVKSRDQICQKMRNSEILQILFLLWLKQERSCQEKTMLSYNCFRILSIYFDRFISAWQSDYLLESMFAVFDKIQFDPKIQPLLENLCQDLVQSSDLKINFLRSLFNYLLGYLSISHDNLNNNRKRWLLTSLGLKTENIKSLYKNVLIPSVRIKIEGLKRTNIWMDKNYIDINEFCLYNNKPLIYVYTSILAPFIMQIPVKEQILDQFRKTAQKLTKLRREILLETALEQFQAEQISIKQQQSMSILIKQLIKKIEWDKKNQSLFENIDFFIPVYLEFPHDKKLQIIKLNSFLLAVVDLQYYTDNTVIKIADLMFTFFANIVSENSNFPQRYEILNLHIEYLRDFSKKCKQSTIAAYYDVICENFNQNVKNYNIETQFCLLWLGFTLHRILIGDEIPSRLKKLKKSIDTRNNKIESLPELNEYFFNKDKLTPLDTDKWKDFPEEKRIFIRSFTSKGADRLESIQRKQGFLRRSNSQINTDHEDNDLSFAEAIDIIGMK